MLSTPKYCDVWGLREEKYKWLESHDVADTAWQELSPSEPYYFLVPKSGVGWDLYQDFWKVTDIFPVNSTGIVTARDGFVIDNDKQSLAARIRDFVDDRYSDEYVKGLLQQILHRRNADDVENYAWRVSEARRQLKGEGDLGQFYRKILYRPFDERWVFYHPAVVWRTRAEVMQHMLQQNFGLILTKRVEIGDFQHVSCVSSLADHHALSLKETNYIFPLYLQANSENQGSLLKGNQLAGGGENINEGFQGLLNQAYNPQPVATLLGEQTSFGVSPEEIFHYIYAVLYSNIYREKYQEFLKVDFPRVPFTKDYALFQKLAKLGNELADLHLLKSPELNNPVAKFQGEDGSLVEKREYKNGRVYINDSQYFEGVAPEVWNYHIGGYQVLDKWLKDRKGRYLSAEDVKHYCRVVTALAKTIELQEEIDKLYPGVEKDLLPD